MEDLVAVLLRLYQNLKLNQKLKNHKLLQLLNQLLLSLHLKLLLTYIQLQ
jgi:hypothetical protein